MTESTVEVIGFVAATLTTGSFVPQVLQTIKTRRTKDILHGMYLAITTGFFLWFVYGVYLNSAPMYLANGVTLILATTYCI